MFNLTEKERFSLLAFSIMHDIGGVENKKGVSKSELEKAKNHCVIGEKTINKFPLISEYENIILYHHENIDGSGYPKGMKEEKLDFPSQILAALDIYQALREKRPYRNCLSHQEAMEILNRMAGEGKLNARVSKDIDTIFKSN
jgi:HD-GYP domain-containing protein (c-di-GMP phosphodiesterase class II)